MKVCNTKTGTCVAGPSSIGKVYGSDYDPVAQTYVDVFIENENIICGGANPNICDDWNGLVYDESLNAIEGAGFVFDHWSGACPCTGAVIGPTLTFGPKTFARFLLNLSLLRIRTCTATLGLNPHQPQHHRLLQHLQVRQVRHHRRVRHQLRLERQPQPLHLRRIRLTGRDRAIDTAEDLDLVGIR